MGRNPEVGFNRFYKLRQVNPVREYDKGFEECKRRVIEILKKDWVGADMSINSCDRYYIDRVKEL